MDRLPLAFILETKRLNIRPWDPILDAESAFAIYGDPEVMRFIGSGEFEKSIESQRVKLQQINDRYADLNNGTGYRALVEKMTGEIVGSIILKQLPDCQGKPTQDYEVGWHLKRSQWEKGYATEAGKAAIEYGFKVLKLPVLYAVTHPANQASIRVTQRLGMIPLGRTTQYYNTELELFKIENRLK